MLLKALGCTSYVEPDIRARNVEKTIYFNVLRWFDKYDTGK